MEIIIRLIVILLVAFLHIAYSYDTIEVFNKNINVRDSGYYISDKNISANEAYTLFTSHAFYELPQKAKSFGFDTKSYWYAFVVSIDSNASERFSLDIRTPSVDKSELYAFSNNALIKHELSSSFVPESKRTIKEFSTQFELLDTNDTVTYLLKIDTKAPRFSAFAFGTQSEIYETWSIHAFIFALTTGIFLFVSFFSLVLYAKLQDRIYLFYVLYIFGLYGSVVITSGHAKPIVQLLPVVGQFFVIMILQAQLVGLTFFSEKLLETKSKIPKIANVIRYLLYINIALSLAFPINPLFKALSFAMTIALFVALLVAAIKVFTRESKIVLYYFIATGIALALMIAFTLMHQGIISYGVFSSNFLTLALIWDMTFLSLAIVNRIELLQRESMENERILTLKSRQETLGELTGNVAHQWRSPLNKIGAIVSSMRAKLMFSEISKEETLDDLTRVSKILKHLSTTIETFQSFLIAKDKQEKFNVSHTLEEMIHWVQTKEIELRYTFESECFVLGEQNEILQAILAIIQNAKEAIIESHVENGYICINLSKNESHVILTIKDNAGGIKLIPIEKVFAPYMSTKQNGTGIGLLLAKTIIEKRHKGKLWVKNDDEGAVFTIELPSH